eukprot:4796695-Prymnesium_polylepis.1
MDPKPEEVPMPGEVPPSMGCGVVCGQPQTPVVETAEKPKRVAPKKDTKCPAIGAFTCIEIKTAAGVDTSFVATSSDGSHQFQIGVPILMRSGVSGPTAIQDAFAAGWGVVQWATDEPGVFETIDQKPFEKQIM